MKQNENCHLQCDTCKIRVYHPGPHYYEDLQENAHRGCFLAIKELEDKEMD